MRKEYQFVTEDLQKMIQSRKIIDFIWISVKLITFGFGRILREQWIRAKYQREEFIHVEKQRYTRGSMEGFLFKRSKVDDTCKQRRFVLSERDNTLKYFVSNVKNAIPIPN